MDLKAEIDALKLNLDELRQVLSERESTISKLKERLERLESTSDDDDYVDDYVPPDRQLFWCATCKDLCEKCFQHRPSCGRHHFYSDCEDGHYGKCDCNPPFLWKFDKTVDWHPSKYEWADFCKKRPLPLGYRYTECCGVVSYLDKKTSEGQLWIDTEYANARDRWVKNKTA